MLPRLRRRASEIGELIRDVCLRHDRGQRLEPAPAREFLARDDERPGAVVDAGRVAGGRRPFGVEDGLQRGELLERGVPPGPRVDGEIADGDDLFSESALVDRGDRALVRTQRPLVLLLARDPELARDERGLLDHVPLVEGGGQAVVRHQVDDRPIAEAVAEPRLLECVRRVRHRLHPADDDNVDVASTNHLVGDLDRADRGGADLVDRVGAELDRQARADRRLPRGRLAGATLEHLAHDRVLDLLVRDACTVERGADDDRAELGRLVAGERAAELPERGANGAENDASGHESSVANDSRLTASQPLPNLRRL